jgi:shikimate dehydrogenase
MRKFGLIGYPLGHSFSKKYFTEKFQKEHLSGCLYENYPLKDIEEIMYLIDNEPDLEGLNVTIPYKSSVMSYLDFISDEASDIGAVNVIKIRRSGEKISLYGYNSDINGIIDTLLPFSDKKGGNAIILGTGGAAKAVKYALNKLGYVVTSVSRKPAEGVITYPELTGEKLSAANLIVNTTPLGMYPDTNRYPDIDYDRLRPGQILFDLVYNPEMTLFLEKGKERECVVLGGIKMLYSQAERAWEIWNDNSL